MLELLYSISLRNTQYFDKTYLKDGFYVNGKYYAMLYILCNKYFLNLRFFISKIAYLITL